MRGGQSELYFEHKDQQVLVTDWRLKEIYIQDNFQITDVSNWVDNAANWKGEYRETIQIRTCSV